MTPTTNPFESAARERKVTDLTNALLRRQYDARREHGLSLAMVEVVHGALGHACGLTDAEWLALNHSTGRRTTVSRETERGVLARLEGMLPRPVVDGNAFEGLAS